MGLVSLKKFLYYKKYHKIDTYNESTFVEGTPIWDLHLQIRLLYWINHNRMDIFSESNFIKWTQLSKLTPLFFPYNKNTPPYSFLMTKVPPLRIN